VPFILSKEIGGSRTMVQGIIDCYFEEEDGLVVLDYKTDYTGRTGLEAIAANYRVQVEIYTEALQKLIGKPVKGTYLYFFDAGESVMIE
jgi:ATP-dependent helicase/nuclease subunit A